MDPGEPVRRSVVGRQCNVSLGSEFSGYLGVGEGSKIFLMANPDRPGTVVVMTTETMKEIVEKGWRAL